MSDCFDHFMDAMEDNMPGGRAYEEGYYEWNFSRTSFIYNPLFYFKQVKYNKIEAETKKAMLVDGIWVPKSLIRELKEDTMYIHTKFLINKAKESRDNE